MFLSRKILIVCNSNSGKISPFVSEQVDSLRELGVIIEVFGIIGRGPLGYLSNLPKLMDRINSLNPDIIHSHYGLAGLLSVLQRRVPVIITFHGSDVNDKINFIFSKIAFSLASDSIFVARELASKMKAKNPNIIPCGVDLDLFHPIDKAKARKLLDLKTSCYYILFSSSFDTPEKNSTLAMSALNLVGKSCNSVELLELKGRNRQEVSLLLSAVDLLLVTSFNEGSPQIVKEALACNCPIVATRVGDIEWLLGEIDGCYLTSFKVEEVADSIIKALDFSRINHRTKGRHRLAVLGLDLNAIAKNIIKIYGKIWR